MKWSEKAWAAIAPVYESTLSLPFIRELMNGTLEEDKFIFYIRQDALYLSAYGRMLTAIATKLTGPEHVEAFIGFAGESLAAEKELHSTFLAAPDAGTPRQPSPSCLLYTSFLLSHLSAPVEVMAAAVLPCFWIYQEAGNYMQANGTAGKNPYRAWISAYGGEAYARSVKKAITVCDELAAQCTAAQQRGMTEAFVMSSKLEWLFWDSAYNLEQWKI
ncbi:MAG: TenA family protein [Tannerella sp.]|jgi:thiaminase/transcriptional activator TenA|nr:TenA family protein [Tannerella sp.]